jgi:hypothetical protein
MRALSTNPNVDNSDLVNYPDGRIKNNTGSGNGTPVNERVYGDIHQAVAKMMRLYNIVPNGLPDNETNGFQIIEAIVALASKNDFILALSLDSGTLSVPIKLGYMLTGEQVVCKASFDLGSQTQIKGSDNVTFGFTPNGTFKTNEYVRLIKTSSGVDIIRLVDNVSLDAMVGDLAYLKKASQTQENAGAIDTRATTPLVNLVAFTRRVIGLDSVNFLATAIRNGLYSTEHFALVEELKKIKNRGTATGLDVNNGSVGTTYICTGDIASCTLSARSGNASSFTVVVSNAMSGTNYYVETYIQSMGSNIFLDNAIGSVVFKPINSTSFVINIEEFNAQVQNLKIHFKVVNI